MVVVEPANLGRCLQRSFFCLFFFHANYQESTFFLDFFSSNTNTQIYKRRFFVSAKEKKVRRDEKLSFVYLFCSKSDFFR